MVLVYGRRFIRAVWFHVGDIQLWEGMSFLPQENTQRSDSLRKLRSTYSSFRFKTYLRKSKCRLDVPQMQGIE